MRLADLNPRWSEAYGRPGDRIGITIDCPGACCAGKTLSEIEAGDKPSDQTKERLFIPFANPPGGAAPFQTTGALWQRTGETFDDLTLTPSVDASAWGHWHGFICDGGIA